MPDDKMRRLKTNHIECKQNKNHNGVGDCLLYLAARLHGSDPLDAFLRAEQFKYIVSPSPYDGEVWTPYLIEMFTMFLNGKDVKKEDFQ